MPRLVGDARRQLPLQSWRLKLVAALNVERVEIAARVAEAKSATVNLRSSSRAPEPA